MRRRGQRQRSDARSRPVFREDENMREGRTCSPEPPNHTGIAWISVRAHKLPIAIAIDMPNTPIPSVLSEQRTSPNFQALSCAAGPCICDTRAQGSKDRGRGRGDVRAYPSLSPSSEPESEPVAAYQYGYSHDPSRQSEFPSVAAPVQQPSTQALRLCSPHPFSARSACSVECLTSHIRPYLHHG